jgi:hypothetical protein
MTLTEQIFTHAVLLVRDCEQDQQELLRTLCRASEMSLRAKLQDGLTPEDCLADFVAAAALYAVAALTETEDLDQVKVGDLTVRHSSRNAAACRLRYQAELMMVPYTVDRFRFTGV